MELTAKQVAIGLIVTAGLSYAGGRWLQPPKVVTETKEVVKEVVKVVEVEKKNSNVVIDRKTITKPTGEVVVEEKIIDKSTTKSETKTAKNSESKTDNSTVVKARPSFTLGIISQNPIPLNGVAPNLGIYGMYNFFGPISAGALINKDLSYGIMVGVSF